MRYKAEYSPSELLCPVSKAAWVRHEVARGVLDAAAPSGCPALAPAEVLAAWEAQGRVREAGLGLALARAVLCYDAQGGGGGMLLLTQRDLRDNPFKARLLAVLREMLLPKAGPDVSSRCLIKID